MTSTIEILLSSLIAWLPRIAIATVGLVLIHTRLRQVHPRAHRYGTIGLALMLVTAFWGVLSQTYIQAARADQTQDVLALTNMMTKANVAGTLVFYASLVLILVAILADRESARSGGREP